MTDSAKHKLNQFFAKGKTQKFNRREIIIRADNDPSGVFFLKEGIVRTFGISQTGEEVTVNIFKPGSFFPMSAVINDGLNRYFFETMTKAVVVKAPKEAVLEFLKQEPDILFDLLRRLYRGIDGLLWKVEYLMSGNAYSRLIVELLIYADRFGEKNGSLVGIDLNLTQKDLASQTGMTRETVSRELAKLKAKGLVEKHRRTIVIRNLDSLNNELSTQH